MNKWPPSAATVVVIGAARKFSFSWCNCNVDGPSIAAGGPVRTGCHWHRGCSSTEHSPVAEGNHAEQNHHRRHLVATRLDVDPVGAGTRDRAEPPATTNHIGRRRTDPHQR